MSRIRAATVALSIPAAFAASAVRAATPPPAESAKATLAELNRVELEIAGRRFPPNTVYNPIYKQQMGQTYGPLYQQEQQLLATYAAADPKAAASARYRTAVDDARLAFWGDEAAKGKLDAAAGGTGPAAADAKLGLMLVDWWSAFGDADAQANVVDAAEQVVAGNPTSPATAVTLRTMVETNPASVALGQRLTTDLTIKVAKTAVGKAYAAVPNKIDEPLAIDGAQLDGKRFKSSAWAGKVVLIDFWATWCPPCREEIPHVVEMYQQYHNQGLEIVGVSSDNDKRELASFLKEHADMAWPELVGGTSGWHPLTKKFGINSIPTMYLIDRNGNLRTVGARSEMAKLIPVLLAEPYTPPAAPPTGKTAGSTATGSATPAGRSAAPPGGVSADDVHDAVRRAATAGMH